MAYKRISQEEVNTGGYRGDGKFFVTLSREVAKRFKKESGARTIYQLPNGAYVVRRTKRSPSTPHSWR